MKLMIVLRNRYGASAPIEVDWPDGLRIPIRGEILLMSAKSDNPDAGLLVDGPVDYVTWELFDGKPTAYLYVHQSG